MDEKPVNHTTTPLLSQDSFDKLCAELKEESTRDISVKLVEHLATTNQLSQEQHEALEKLL